MALTANQVIDFLASTRKLPELQEDTALFSDGTIDSVGMIELIAFLESEAGIEVGQADVTLENFDTVTRIVDFVRSRQG
jgi:D-alanine--poly(phosphoribitol) ligase subunit 2